MKTNTQKPPRPALLQNVRKMLCEPESTDENGQLESGLRYHAACMIADGHRQISDLAGRYVDEGSREIQSIISTARTQTEWLLSEPMCSDLKKNGVNWSQLAEKPTSVFVMIPAHFLETQEGSVWLRLIVMSALRDLYGRAGQRNVEDIVFLLSEFPALKKLSSVETAKAQGRKYGLRIVFVIQDIHQLTGPDMYGPRGADSFAGQCDAVIAFAPGDWESAEHLSRRAGEEPFISENLSQSDDRPGLNRNYTIQMRRAWPPERILDLPKFHGLVFFHGQSKAVPVYCAPYWELPCKRVARPDPYHPASSKRGPGRKVRRAIAAVLAVALAGAVLSGVTSGVAGRWLSAVSSAGPVQQPKPKEAAHGQTQKPPRHTTRQ
jgi:type IV secretion system protein VirD4